ncbi:D-alanine--D-alanine ligase [Ruminococcaceae bacterium OttesenSCG-928-I18]|nr:D-alanine--D-alanine ligase [Ruminococcaceae bacterium OttesenSCG-928-I18]
MAKIRVALLFGGVSSEHDISCISAAAIADNLGGDKYEVYKIGITKKGRWLLYPGGTEEMRKGKWDKNPDNVPAILSPDRVTHGLVVSHEGNFDTVKIDVVFPALHGRNGEDGTVQGLMDLAGIPYVGCDVLASAACMNKVAANRLFEAVGVPKMPWVAAGRRETGDFDNLLFRLKEVMQFPLFVKPAVGGSSIGISKVKGPEELVAAVKLASAHDKLILFEQGVDGQEVECAVLGNEDPLVSIPGEIRSCNEMYDFEAKYESGDASELLIPAELPEEKREEVQSLAKRAYKALGCSGLSRVDFLVERGTGKVFINEINTMPGFTTISMYPKLMEKCGFTFPELCNQLIHHALERAEV